MSDSRHSKEIRWHIPEHRAIFDLRNIRIPRSVRQLLNKKIYRFSTDTIFEDVIRGCADSRQDTWMNDEIIERYTKLHKAGYAHSVEVWQGEYLMGGLYGVQIGGAFFGESMFGIASNVTKLAFYYLCGILIKNRFMLLDSQYINDFTRQLGAIEIPHEEYIKILEEAVNLNCEFEDKY